MMTMKVLDIKHVAAYLPYDVKIKFDYIDSYGSHVNKIETLKPKHFVKGYVNCLAGKSKPILYPKSHIWNLKDDILILWGGGVPSEHKNVWASAFAENLQWSAYHALPYEQVEFMLKHHIDVFGLIDQGLAIDKTSL